MRLSQARSPPSSRSNRPPEPASRPAAEIFRQTISPNLCYSPTVTEKQFPILSLSRAVTFLLVATRAGRRGFVSESDHRELEPLGPPMVTYYAAPTPARKAVCNVL